MTKHDFMTSVEPVIQRLAREAAGGNDAACAVVVSVMRDMAGQLHAAGTPASRVDHYLQGAARAAKMQLCPRAAA